MKNAKRLFALIFILTISCTKTTEREIRGRLPASLQTPECEIERHQEFRDHYRMRYMGEPMTNIGILEETSWNLGKSLLTRGDAIN